MAERIYSYDEVHAAMCIMEEIASPGNPEEPQPWVPYREQWGVDGLRDAVITKLAGACDRAWSRANANPDQPDDPGSFDYEFVPIWLRLCVDWSGDHPQVRGSHG